MAEAVNIKEQLKLLVKLQDIDTQIYNFKKEKEEIPIEITRLERIFEQKKIHFNNVEEKSKQLVRKRKTKELDLATKEEEIKKLTTQLYSLKTNKEYQTMLAQIAGLKSDNSLIEEDILRIMEEQDTLKEELNKQKVLLSEEEKKLQGEENKAEERIKEIDYSINDLASKRNQICPSLDKHILPHYERILKGRDGLALVKVQNGSCQGCFMNVTPQVINEIKMLERIVTCEVCARILYLEEDL